MAEVVVAFVVESLGDLLTQEAEALHGVSHQVEEIQDGLRSLQCFLKEAEARQNEHHVRAWIADLRDIAYNALDVLESYLVNVASTKRRKGIKNILCKYICTLNQLEFCNSSIKSRIQAVRTRIGVLTTRSQIFGIRSTSVCVANDKEIPIVFRDYYIHTVADQQLVVGLDKDIEDLVAHLVNDDKDNCSSVVGIYGMGGLGKTTLASKVYNHVSVKRHFTCFAWVCVSQKWQRDDILKQILLKLDKGQGRDRVNAQSGDELVKEIFEIQHKRRCLVVLDDIWSDDVWDCLKAAFPAESGSFSKILLTTRIKQVAEHVADAKGILHQPKLLDEDQSWELLLKKTCINKIVGAGGSIDVNKMEVLGREMVRHCDGLPLGILVLGGILATKPTLTEWERVHETVMSHLNVDKGMGEEHRTEVLRILELSYHNLPNHLKLCFLHLGQFREDSEIDAEKLYLLWMAEGFILSNDRREEEQETTFSVAERYLCELAHRSMVVVQLEEEEVPIRKLKSCRLHDLMRDLSLQKGDDAKFFKALQPGIVSDEEQQLVMESSCSSTNYPRGVVIAHGHDLEAIFSRKDCYLDNKVFSKCLRSLIFDLEQELFRPEKAFVTFLGNKLMLLKVLSLENLIIDTDYEQKMILEAISNLKILRYVSLKNSILQVSPVFNSEYLETVNFSVCRTVEIAQDMVRNTIRLQHLYLPNNSCAVGLVGGTTLKLSGSTKLEILENFDPAWCEIKDLYSLNSLRKLKILVEDEVEDVEEIINYLASTSSSSLLYLSLHIWTCDLDTGKGPSLLRQLFANACGRLYELLIWGNLEDLMAFDDNVNHLSSLTVLFLGDSTYREDPMRVLEKIPNLHCLTLELSEVVGKEMVCSATGFCQLKKLTLQSISTLERWRVDEGAMPNLFYLKIVSCSQMMMLPDGLRFLANLRELDISHMPRVFMERVVGGVVDGQEGEDFYKVRHVASISLSRPSDN